MRIWVILFMAVWALNGCSAEESRANKDSADYWQTAEDNLRKGVEFLDANALKPGMVVLDSGLQYRVLRRGGGISPEADDQVTVDYRGLFIDGEEFDSSYARGKPMAFKLDEVIPGWTEALQMMKEGGKWQLYIPQQLAYGSAGAGQAIGPGQTLIFEVELLKVHGKETP